MLTLQSVRAASRCVDRPASVQRSRDCHRKDYSRFDAPGAPEIVGRKRRTSVQHHARMHGPRTNTGYHCDKTKNTEMDAPVTPRSASRRLEPSGPLSSPGSSVPSADHSFPASSPATTTSASVAHMNRCSRSVELVLQATYASGNPKITLRSEER